MSVVCPAVEGILKSENQVSAVSFCLQYHFLVSFCLVSFCPVSFHPLSFCLVQFCPVNFLSIEFFVWLAFVLHSVFNRRSTREPVSFATTSRVNYIIPYSKEFQITSCLKQFLNSSTVCGPVLNQPE